MNLNLYAKAKKGTGKLGCPVFAAVAAKAMCSPATVYQISLGHKSASAVLARRIDSATNGQVSVSDLRPDVFGPAPGAADDDDDEPLEHAA